MADNHQATTSAERVYAEALLDMAVESGSLQAVMEELEDLSEIVAAQPDVLKLFSSKLLSTEERAASLQRIFKGRVSDLLFHFLLVLNDKERLGDIQGVIRAFNSLYEEREGIVEVDAYVPQRMEDAQAAGIAERLGQALGRKVVLHQYVDAELLGGLKIRIGDKILDGSVVAQLRMLREKMVDRGLENARQRAAKL